MLKKVISRESLLDRIHNISFICLVILTVVKAQEAWVKETRPFYDCSIEEFTFKMITSGFHGI